MAPADCYVKRRTQNLKDFKIDSRLFYRGINQLKIIKINVWAPKQQEAKLKRIDRLYDNALCPKNVYNKFVSCFVITIDIRER